MLASILPPEVIVAEVFGDRYDHGGLLAAEKSAVAGAGLKRRREFTAVRVCARQALARAGLPPAAIVPGPSGAPLWPPGVVGSMTHCAGYRACAIGRAEQITAIGIDAEPHDELPGGVLALVATESEQAALARLRRSAPETCWDRILFSAKEAVFKAWWPGNGRHLGFKQAELTVEPDGTFLARLSGPGPAADGQAPVSYRGRWLVASELIATAVVVTAGQVSCP
jgi:4'-phosphopantetheinyl transferase EntD